MDGVDEADGVKNDVFNDVDDDGNDTDEVKATEVDKVVVTDEVNNDGSGEADSVTEEEVEGCDTAELTVASSKRSKRVKKVRLIVIMTQVNLLSCNFITPKKVSLVHVL